MRRLHAGAALAGPEGRVQDSAGEQRPLDRERWTPVLQEAVHEEREVVEVPGQRFRLTRLGHHWPDHRLVGQLAARRRAGHERGPRARHFDGDCPPQHVAAQKNDGQPEAVVVFDQDRLLPPRQRLKARTGPLRRGMPPVVVPRRSGDVGYSRERGLLQVARPARIRFRGSPELVALQVMDGRHAALPASPTLEHRLGQLERMEDRRLAGPGGDDDHLVDGRAERHLCRRKADGDRDGGTRHERYVQLPGGLVHMAGLFPGRAQVFVDEHRERPAILTAGRRVTVEELHAAVLRLAAVVQCQLAPALDIPLGHDHCTLHREAVSAVVDVERSDLHSRLQRHPEQLVAAHQPGDDEVAVRPLPVLVDEGRHPRPAHAPFSAKTLTVSSSLSTNSSWACVWTSPLIGPGAGSRLRRAPPLTAPSATLITHISRARLATTNSIPAGFTTQLAGWSTTSIWPLAWCCVPLRMVTRPSGSAREPAFRTQSSSRPLIASTGSIRNGLTPAGTVATTWSSAIRIAVTVPSSSLAT